MSGEPPQFFADLAAVRSRFESLRLAGLASLFASDEWRAQSLSLECGHLYVDFSKQFVSVDLIQKLCDFARHCGVDELRNTMLAGAPVNTTEQRPALHTALRDEKLSTPEAQIAQKELEKAAALADKIHAGGFTDVVNIGIGGSDLGPAMAYTALRRFREGPRVHFVSNIDPADLDSVLSSCEANKTLFVVVSKTFTTAETMRNANRARQWLSDAGVSEASPHFVACTSAPDVASRWGIDETHVLAFWPWVGGRFSLSSVAGFSLMLGIGVDNFRRMLHGMYTMDEHFASAPFEQNVAVLHGLIAFMNASIAGWSAVAVVPYSHDLARLPAFLQQLIMESNGKSVKANGKSVVFSTSPIVWGEAGTNGQHAFFQLLHQGTHVIPVDFIGVATPTGSDSNAHQELIANMVAQSRALAFGRSHEEIEDTGSSAQLVPHRVSSGNRPSTTLFASSLTPEVLGEIIALYEHSTVVQGWMMGVNSFDQWGVELGKTIAKDVLNSLHHGGGVSEFDSSTNELLHWYLTHRD
jgi:glucose-6-phosphate isomerase